MLIVDKDMDSKFATALELLIVDMSIYQQSLFASIIDTILGKVIIIASDQHLYLLAFVDKKSLLSDIKSLCKTTKRTLSYSSNAIIDQTRDELVAYFVGNNPIFTVPYMFIGSAFQCAVWQRLAAMPPAATSSYGAIAQSIGSANSYRAVANANAANRLAIIIPCHRIITISGDIGGYSAGIERKVWLLAHERRHYGNS